MTRVDLQSSLVTALSRRLGVGKGPAQVEGPAQSRAQDSAHGRPVQEGRNNPSQVPTSGANQVGQNTAPAGACPVRSTADARNATRAAGGARASNSVLSQRTLQHIRAIDRDDPGRTRKAWRIFLEAAVLAELGEQVRQDPAFYQLIEAVQETMQADAELADAIQRAMDSLLTSGG